MLLSQKVLGAGGNVQNEVTLNSWTISNNGTFLFTPQAGDLLISTLGDYAFNYSFTSGITQILKFTSATWSSPYKEFSAIGYRICDGTEGTNYALSTGGNTATLLYRFSKPVKSVTIPWSYGVQGILTFTLSMSSISYTKPHIVLASTGAYQGSSVGYTVSNSLDFDFTSGYLKTAGFINTTTTNLTSTTWSSPSVSFKPARTAAFIIPNF